MKFKKKKKKLKGRPKEILFHKIYGRAVQLSHGILSMPKPSWEFEKLINRKALLKLGKVAVLPVT